MFIGFNQFINENPQLKNEIENRTVYLDSLLIRTFISDRSERYDKSMIIGRIKSKDHLIRVVKNKKFLYSDLIENKIKTIDFLSNFLLENENMVYFVSINNSLFFYLVRIDKNTNIEFQEKLANPFYGNYFITVHKLFY